jgi:hypothetical protein
LEQCLRRTAPPAPCQLGRHRPNHLSKSAAGQPLSILPHRNSDLHLN